MNILQVAYCFLCSLKKYVFENFLFKKILKLFISYSILKNLNLYFFLSYACILLQLRCILLIFNFTLLGYNFQRLLHKSLKYSANPSSHRILKKPPRITSLHLKQLCQLTEEDTMHHRVIILLERACLHNRTGRNWCKFSRPECATSQRDVTRDCALIG